MSEFKRALLRCLECSPVFRGLEPETLRALVESARFRTHKKGQVLYRRNEQSDDLLVVLEGRLEIVRRMTSGRSMHLRTLGACAIVGWSMLAGEAHTADLSAATRLKVARIPGTGVRRLFQRYPQVPLRMIASLGVLVGKLSDELEDLRFKSLDQRVWGAVCELCQPGGGVSVTHAELAEIVGVTREHVSRALGRLATKGLIERGRGWIRRLR